MRRAILRGGLRLRGGTTKSSEEEDVEEANRVGILLVVEEVVVAALDEEKAAGENADEDVTAIDAMTAAVQSFIVGGVGLGAATMTALELLRRLRHGGK